MPLAHPTLVTSAPSLPCGTTSTMHIPPPPTHPTSHAPSPNGNHLPPVIQAAADLRDRTICSTITCLAVEHCFNMSYSLHFCKGADDNTLCPCSNVTPTLTLNPNIRHRPQRQHHPHTKQHIVLHCILTQPSRTSHLHKIHTWEDLFTSYSSATRLCAFLKVTNSSLLWPLLARPSVGPV